MSGMVNATEGYCLLWNIERTMARIYIPVLLSSVMGDRGCRELVRKRV